MARTRLLDTYVVDAERQPLLLSWPELRFVSPPELVRLADQLYRAPHRRSGGSVTFRRNSPELLCAFSANDIGKLIIKRARVFALFQLVIHFDGHLRIL